MVFAVALFCALAAQPAPAEQWISIAKTTDSQPVETFIDISNITMTDGIRIAQTKHILLVPWPENVPPGDRVSFSLQRMSFDCNAGLVKQGSYELHYPHGRLGFMDLTQLWQPVDDPSIKRMMDLVCAWMPPRSPPGF